jgi:hypothetical protein
MRTIIKDKAYLEDYIGSEQERIKKLLNWIEIGKVKEERIPSTRSEIFRTSLHLIIARYSIGQNINLIRNDFPGVIDQMTQVWRDTGRTPQDDIHFDTYVLMLWMLSLGVLLEIEDDYFEKIVSVLRRSNRIDYLFEFLIAAKIKTAVIPNKLSYEKQYRTLMIVSKEPDKKEAVEKLKIFLDKEWYPAMNLTYWYDDHKSKHDTFFGYWSFESAAVAKIRGFNDDILENQQYYPYDLVHWRD